MMKPRWPLFAFVVVAGVVVLCSAIAGMRFEVVHAAGKPMTVGVCRSNMGWLKTDEQHKVIDAMKANGVKAVRFSLKAPEDRSLDAIQYATQQGIGVLMVVSVGDEDFFPPGTEAPPSVKGKGVRVRPLSKLDPERYRAAMAPIFKKLDDEHVALMAIEVGNEINWAPSNGDLAVHPGHPEQAVTDLAKMPNRAAIEAGLAKYVEVLRITRELMKSSVVNQHAILLSGGLAGALSAFAESSGMDLLPQDFALKYLQAHGIVPLVDAYALHNYPKAPTAPERMASLQSATSSCGTTAGGGKPCWFTEWGVVNRDASCPANEKDRLPLVKELRGDFSQLHDQGKVTAIFYFDWDTGGQNQYEIYKCGGLTASGVAALAP